MSTIIDLLSTGNFIASHNYSNDAAQLFVARKLLLKKNKNKKAHFTLSKLMFCTTGTVLRFHLQKRKRHFPDVRFSTTDAIFTDRHFTCGSARC